MGLRSQASENPTLTNYASGVVNDLASAVADFIAPKVQVPATIGQYKAYDNKNAFQTYDTDRGVGGTARRIFMDVSEPTYNCLPQALEITIDDSERDAAGPSDPLVLEQAKVKTLVQSSVLSHEKKVWTKLDAISADASHSDWGAAGTPIKDIDSQIVAVAKETGMMPNAIVFGVEAWTLFRNNSKVIERQPGAALIGLGVDQAAGFFVNPGVEIRVSTMAYDTLKRTTDSSRTQSFFANAGRDIYIFLRSPNPTIYDPSAFKTFTGGRGGVTAVRNYRDESARSDVYAVDWSVDVQTTSSICIKKLTVTA